MTGLLSKVLEPQSEEHRRSDPDGCIGAFTGVSGSGKSSLAIDTIHATNQQWYLEGLSPFIRKFLVPDDRPDVDSIVEQASRRSSSAAAVTRSSPGVLSPEPRLQSNR